MSKDAFNQLQKPLYLGMTDCVHRPEGVELVKVPCPCGRVDTLAYINCDQKGRIRALQCRMFCDKYAERKQEK